MPVVHFSHRMKAWQHISIAAAHARARGESVVLATVLRVRGSAYGRPGTRMLVRRHGRAVGFVSGGCLEREVIRQALDVRTGSPRRLTFDTRPGGAHAAYSAGCAGVVDVLVERIEPDETATHLDALAEVLDAHDPLVQAIVHGSDDPDWPVGRRLTPDDADSPESVRHAMASVRRTAAQTQLTMETHGGTTEWFVERLLPRPRLVIFGGGPDVPPVARLAGEIGWHVTIVTRKPGELDGTDTGDAEIRWGVKSDTLKALSLTPNTHVVVMTHDFEDDLWLLPRLLRSPTPDIAVLGPRARTARLFTAMHAAGAAPTAGDLDRLHTPAGLDLGGRGPESIALSIVSEREAIRHGRTGGRLADRAGPIHAPEPDRRAATVHPSEVW